MKRVYSLTLLLKKNKLYYVGNKPSKTYYNNISDHKYNNIPDQDWNLEKETLNYLSSDLEGLLEVILKFRYSIFNRYQLNITKHFLKHYQD